MFIIFKNSFIWKVKVQLFTSGQCPPRLCSRRNNKQPSPSPPLLVWKYRLFVIQKNFFHKWPTFLRYAILNLLHLEIFCITFENANAFSSNNCRTCFSSVVSEQLNCSLQAARYFHDWLLTFNVLRKSRINIR